MFLDQGKRLSQDAVNHLLEIAASRGQLTVIYQIFSSGYPDQAVGQRNLKSLGISF